jgi:hypothetical protein
LLTPIVAQHGEPCVIIAKLVDPSERQAMLDAIRVTVLASRQAAQVGTAQTAAAQDSGKDSAGAADAPACAEAQPSVVQPPAAGAARDVPGPPGSLLAPAAAAPVAGTAPQVPAFTQLSDLPPGVSAAPAAAASVKACCALAVAEAHDAGAAAIEIAAPQREQPQPHGAAAAPDALAGAEEHDADAEMDLAEPQGQLDGPPASVSAALGALAAAEAAGVARDADADMQFAAVDSAPALPPSSGAALEALALAQAAGGPVAAVSREADAEADPLTQHELLGARGAPGPLVAMSAGTAARAVGADMPKPALQAQRNAAPRADTLPAVQEEDEQMDMRAPDSQPDQSPDPSAPVASSAPAAIEEHATDAELALPARAYVAGQPLGSDPPACADAPQADAEMPGVPQGSQSDHDVDTSAAPGAAAGSNAAAADAEMAQRAPQDEPALQAAAPQGACAIGPVGQSAAHSAGEPAGAAVQNACAEAEANHGARSRHVIFVVLSRCQC